MDAAREYLKDLRSAMNYADIDEDVLVDVNEAIEEFKVEIGKAIEKE